MTFRLPTIASALEFRREAYGWTRMRMAAALGIGRGHYTEVIQGKRALPFNAACKAYEMGVPAAVLLQTRETKRRYEERQAQELAREKSEGIS